MVVVCQVVSCVDVLRYRKCRLADERLPCRQQCRTQTSDYECKSPLRRYTTRKRKACFLLLKRKSGIGVWGMGGNLINAAPQVHTQDFANELATPHYPNVRIHSGSHVFIGSGSGTNMNSLQFFANYFFTSAPTSAKLWLQGVWIDLTCKPGWGSASNCVYTSDVLATMADCRLYFFQFVDSAGTTRYPETVGRELSGERKFI